MLHVSKRAQTSLMQVVNDLRSLNSSIVVFIHYVFELIFPPVGTDSAHSSVVPSIQRTIHHFLKRQKKKKLTGSRAAHRRSLRRLAGTIQWNVVETSEKRRNRRSFPLR